MINLNDSSFDAKEVKIFNGGVAGIVNNVTVSLEKKKPEDKEKAPDYKVIFTDESGASCNTSFYYVTEPTQYATVEKQIANQGKVLKHLLHAVISPSFQFPQFDTPKAMLDGCMMTLKQNAVQGAKFRIFCNYGSIQSPKQFLQPRSWVPFIESMSVTESRLEVGKIDQMERIEADSQSGSASTTSSSAAGSPASTDGW